MELFVVGKKNKSSGKISFNVSKDNKDKFYLAKGNYLESNPNLSNDDFINYLLTLIKSDDIMFHYSKDIHNIAQIQNLPVGRVCEEAIIAYIKKIKKANKKGLTDNMKTLKSDNLINQVINGIISHNDKNEHLHRIFINQTALARFAVDAEKINVLNLKPHKFARSVIARGLKNNAETISKHHAQHNLTSSHNAQVYNAKRFSANNEVDDVSNEKVRSM